MTAWKNFWFSTGPRHSTGVLRILLAGWILLDCVSFLPGLSAVAARPESLFFPAAGLRWFGIGWPGDWIPVLVPAAWVLAAAAFVGAGTRVSLLGLAAVNWILQGFASSWVYVGHASILPAVALVILAFSPGVRAWSLDALLEALARRRAGDPQGLFRRLAGAPIPAWPVRLILAVLALTYLAAGIAKIRDGRADWFSGRTLQWYLEGQAGQKRLGDSTQFFVARRSAPAEARFRDPWGLERIANSAGPSRLGKLVARSRAACAVASWLSAVLELAFVLVLFVPRAAQAALLVSMALFHGGIALLMGIDFSGYVVLYLAVLDWNAVLRAVPSWFAGSSPRA